MSQPQQTRPVLVAGVVGGSGARTVARLLGTAVQADPIMLAPQQRHCDVLVCPVQASATAVLPRALSFIMSAPVLVIAHTVPGPMPSASRARIRSAQAHTREIVHVPFEASWIGLDEPPGRQVSKRSRTARDQIVTALHQQAKTATPWPQQAIPYPAPSWTNNI